MGVPTMWLIDANNVRGLFDAEFKKTWKLITAGETHLNNLAEGFLEAYQVIQNMPTVDAEVVVHGTWEGTADEYADGELFYNVWHCSNCGWDVDGAEIKPDFQYCPKCGCCMDV